MSREIETGVADDGESGVFTTDNVTMAAYVAVPLLAFALLACFCAIRRRNRSDSDDGSAGAWAGGSSAKGGRSNSNAAVTGHADAAAAAGAGAATGHRATDGGGKVFPDPRSLSPGNSLSLQVEDMNLAEHIVVGASGAGGAGAAAAAAAGRGEQGGAGGAGGGKTKNPKKFARCESDTAFAMTSSENITDDFVGGGGARSGGSDSSGGAGTGRSSSPPGFEDDAAGSVFDSADSWAMARENKTRTSPPSYEQTRRREQQAGRPAANR